MLLVLLTAILFRSVSIETRAQIYVHAHIYMYMYMCMLMLMYRCDLKQCVELNFTIRVGGFCNIH